MRRDQKRTCRSEPPPHRRVGVGGGERVEWERAARLQPIGQRGGIVGLLQVDVGAAGPLG
jgi:hypothetical protein